jgi:Nuclease-related domain
MGGGENLILITTILLFVLIALLIRIKSMKQMYETSLLDSKEQAAATMEKVTLDFEQEKQNLYKKDQVIEVAKKLKKEWEEGKDVEFKVLKRVSQEILEKEKMEIEQAYEGKIHVYENQLKTLQNQINEYRKYSRNFGEVTTHHILEKMREELVTSEVISSIDDIIIMGNVFIPFINQNQDVHSHSRQIDHLVISRKGIFVIESKYWKGTILYGLNKKRANEFSFILEAFYPKIKDQDEKTIVFRSPSDAGENKEIQVVSYDDPAKQVKSAAWTLNQFLKSKGINIYCTPIVYFGYQEKNFKNYSNLNEPLVYDKEKEFINLFSNELTSRKNIEHINLEQIKNIIEEANYY